MADNRTALIASALALVLLTFIVGLRMLSCRVREMRSRRIHPQSVATSIQMASRLEDSRAADNFRNLFEVPVLFYALVSTAVAAASTPAWLVLGAWFYVGLRVAHSAIQCSYNKVMHRLAVFMTSFGLLVGLWIAFVASL